VAKSLQGQFLIASPQLLDRNFARSVVLLVRHGEDGALGLIVNRPLNAKLESIWDQVSQTQCAVDRTLYHGGPCEGPLMVLHTNPAQSQIQAADGVHFTADREMIEQLVCDETADTKFFVGYAGWAVGQLESEIAEGSWLSFPASGRDIFGEDEALWDNLVRRAHRAAVFPWLDPKRIPEDPSVN
jgi:putative transcriptional regulator